MSEKIGSIFVKGIFSENPTFRMVLAICSTLAVTNRVDNSVAMSLGVIFVTLFSSISVSLLRNYIPFRVRMAVYTVIIATYVVFVDIFLKAFYPDISEQLGPYVGLIITNCIIMGRTESFASGNPPLPSAADALGVTIGYGFSLLTISVIREGLGFGTIMGYPVLGPSWTPWLLMVMSPGAFLVVGCYIWLFRGLPARKGGR